MKYQTQEEFEAAFAGKIVNFKEARYILPAGWEGKVTASLLNYDDDNSTIFAIVGKDYTPENPCWITWHLADDELDKFLENLEILCN